MSNLIPLEDAAKLLGLTVEKLNEMRSNSEIFGYKDGVSWKFKMQELERVADEFDISINVGAAAGNAADDVVELVEDKLDLKLDDDDEIEFDFDDSSEDLKLEEDKAEVKLADDDEIQLLDDDDDDDIKLLDDDDGDEIQLFDDDDDDLVVAKQEAPDFDDDIKIVEDVDKPAVVAAKDLNDSDEIQLFDDDDDDFSMKEEDDDISLVNDEPKVEKQVTGGDDGLDLAMDDDDDFQLSDSADVLNLDDDDGEEDLAFGSSDIRLAGDEEVKVEAADESGFMLEDDDSDLQLVGGEDSKADDSGIDLAGDLDESSDMLLGEDDLFEDDLQIQESHEDDIDLSSDFEESEELIMDDSDSSTDLIGASEDSGLILEEDSGEIDLGGSSLMDLAGEEDDEMIVLDEPVAADAATELAGDDFNLTPLEELSDEDSSGSQVIALEDSDMFTDDSASTLLQPSDEMAAEPMLTEDALDVGEFDAFDAAVPGMAAGMVVAGAAGALPEQPYTIAQIGSLGLVFTLLGIGGMIGYDLARNLWLPEDQIVTSGILKMILSVFGS